MVHVNAYGIDFANLINRAKIIINIHAENFLDTETRVFEVLGCGGFLISERLSEESPFISKTHLIEVDSLLEMSQQIHYYLKHSEKRYLISKRGCDEANANHTYAHRAKEIIDKMSGLSRNRSLPIIDHNKINRYKQKEKFQYIFYKAVFKSKKLYKHLVS